MGDSEAARRRPLARVRPPATMSPLTGWSMARQQVSPLSAGRFPQPSSRSMARRSRLVGRPEPFSRASTCCTRRSRHFSYSTGGVRSAQNCGTAFAPTRERGRPTTSSVRVRSPCRTTIRSPTRTTRAGLAGSPAIATLPARQASVASARVEKIRTAQSHLSRRGAAEAESDAGAEAKTVASLSDSRPRAKEIWTGPALIFSSRKTRGASSRPAGVFRTREGRCGPG